MTNLALDPRQPAQPEGAPAIPPGSRVYLIDGSGYIFRAFHALPPLTRPSDGLPVGRGARLLQHAVEALARDQRRKAADAPRRDFRPQPR